MVSLLQISNSNPSITALCTTILLHLGFTLGFGMYIGYVGPTFVSSIASFDRDGLAQIVLTLLQTYLAKSTALASQLVTHTALSAVSSLPLPDVIILLQYLTPLLETFELIFSSLERFVSYLDATDSFYYTSFNLIWEELRNIGNELFEYYRALEDVAGISIDQSRIPEQWFES